MRKSTLFVLFILGILVLTGGLLLKQRRTEAAPTVLTGSLQGGCYLIAETTCTISIQPFTISIAPGETLLSFHLYANDQVLYDFAASTDKPPSGDFTPSPVALAFAARCGHTYTLELQALDTGDLNDVTIGKTALIACPAVALKTFLPVLER